MSDLTPDERAEFEDKKARSGADSARLMQLAKERELSRQAEAAAVQAFMERKRRVMEQMAQDEIMQQMGSYPPSAAALDESLWTDFIEDLS